MPGAPDVEDYINSISNLNHILNVGEFVPGVQIIPPDYFNIGEITKVKNARGAFPGISDYNNFLFKIYSGSQPDARDSWNGFRTAAGQDGANITKLTQAFLNQLGIQLGIPHDPDSAGNLGDFETLYQALGGNAVLGSRNSFKSIFLENALDYFFVNYDFTIPSSSGATFGEGGLDPTDDWEGEFSDQFSLYFSSRASADQDLFHGGFAGASNEDLVMYEKMFNEFVVQPPIKPFDTVLAEFYNEMVARDGFFLPSQQLKDWFATVQTQQSLQAGTATSVAGTNSQKTAILLTLFRLLVELIEVLQKVAAAQGERLRFYAGYQKAYTDLLKNIPIINEQNVKDALGNDSTSNQQAVMSFTQSQNQSFTEKVRSFRSVIGDEAKQHQTTVNQSNEIVTQQANLGTSILQQLSTILTNMFK